MTKEPKNFSELQHPPEYKSSLEEDFCRRDYNFFHEVGERREEKREEGEKRDFEE